MESKGISISFLSFLGVAIGLIEAYKLGVPWYLGVGVAVILDVVSYFGIIPILGQVFYFMVGKWFLNSVVGVWFGALFWYNFVVSVLMSLVVIFIVVIWGWR